MKNKFSQLYKFNINLPEVRGVIKKNFQLSRLSWLKVGGPASVFQPEDEDDLSFFLRTLNPHICNRCLFKSNYKRWWYSWYRNKTWKKFSKIKYNKNDISVGAGCRDLFLHKFVRKMDLTFFLRTIPGNIGGAVKMNAGCYGSYLSDYLIGLTLIRRDGSKIYMNAIDFKFGYRVSSVPDDAVITNIKLRKNRNDPLLIEKKMIEALDNRNVTQPIKDLSCGSTFRNPIGRSSLGNKLDNDHSLKAWKLIDDAGLRGYKIGGAMISKKHTNFLINTGKATAKDLEDLGKLVINKVKKNSGIELIWEIKRVGIT